MALRLVTDATSEPVTLPEIKLHLRLSTSDTVEDTLLSAYIKAARVYAENLTKRAFLPQTWQLTLDHFPETIYLPRPPLATGASAVVISYLDETSGNSTTLNSTIYRRDCDSEPGRVYLDYGRAWPNTYDVKSAITVQYACGNATVEEDVKTWIKMRVGQMYEYREPLIGGSINELPRSFIDGLIDRYCMIEVAP